MSQKISKKALEGLLRDLNGKSTRKEVSKVKKPNKLPDTKKGLKKFKLAQRLLSKKKEQKSHVNPLDELRGEKEIQEKNFQKNLEYFKSTTKTSSSEKELRKQVLERLSASAVPKSSKRDIDSDDEEYYQ
ncbi:hypothetical protein K7432_005990 [Basidiobolus ranarum]|uniref:Active regulator of SIRT1 n=1 Tax=Basidiobolus ranarum TaxID=34480 RepID=A0ABR2WVL7_9FUNG